MNGTRFVLTRSVSHALDVIALVRAWGFLFSVMIIIICSNFCRGNGLPLRVACSLLRLPHTVSVSWRFCEQKIVSSAAP